MLREVVSDFDGARELARVTPIGAKTNPQWTIQDVDNFDEWFEEIEEPTDSKNWKAYQASLKPYRVGGYPDGASMCPNCGKFVNVVNPYDDGETWMK